MTHFIQKQELTGEQQKAGSKRQTIHIEKGWGIKLIYFITLLNKLHVFLQNLVKTRSLTSTGLCESGPGCESPVWTGTLEVWCDDLQQRNCNPVFSWICTSTITAKHPTSSFFNLWNLMYLLQVILFEVFAKKKKMFCCFFRQFNLRCNVISAVILSVRTGICANICIKMRNNASEQVPLSRFDLRWLTWQKGQCRADGPYFRSQEAPNPAELTETSPVCGGRNLSHSAGTSLHEPESLWPLGLIASGPHRFLCDTSKPCAIHLLQTAAAHLRFLLRGEEGGGHGLQSEMQGLPVLCLLGSTIFWLPLSLFMLLARARRGPAVCPAQSSDFKLQGCRNSWPYSWIHLFATGRRRGTL